MLAQKITKNLILISHSFKYNPSLLKELSDSKNEWEKTHYNLGHSSELGDIEFKKAMQSLRNYTEKLIYL